MANINLGHIKGDAGPGVSTGGTSGQFISKNTNDNYDTIWTNPPLGIFNPTPVERIYFYNTSTTTATYTDKNGNTSNLSYSWSGSTCNINIPQALLDGEIHEVSFYFSSTATNPSFTITTGSTTASIIYTRLGYSYGGGMYFNINVSGNIVSFPNNGHQGVMWIKKI